MQTEKSNHWKIVTAYLAILLCVISPIVCAKPFISFHKEIRFILLSIGLIPILLWIYKTYMQPKADTHSRTPSLFNIHYFDVFLLLFAFFQYASITWATNTAEAVFMAQKFFIGLVIYFLSKIILHFYGHKTIIFFVKVICFSGFVYYLHTSFATYHLLQWVKANGFNSSLSSTSFYYLKSLTGHKHSLSTFFFLLLSFHLLGLARTSNHWWRYVYLVGIFFQLLFLLLLQSRSVLVGLVAFTVMFIIGLLLQKSLWHFLKKHALVLGGLFSLIVFTLLVLNLSIVKKETFFEKMNVTTYSTSRSGIQRLRLWDKTADMIQHQCLLGVGTGNWAVAILSEGAEGVERFSVGRSYLHPDNDFLWIWSELGTVGLSLHLLLLGNLFWATLKAFQQRSTYQYPLLILSAAFVGYLCISLFIGVRRLLLIQSLLMVLIAFLVYYIQQTPNYKAFFSFYLSKKTMRIACILTTFMLLLSTHIAIKRYQGAKYSFYLKKNISAAQWQSLETRTNKALSPFYTLNKYARPLHYYIALAQYKQGKTQVALKNYEQALHHHPYYYPALTGIGNIYFDRGQIKKARNYYVQAIRINSFDDEANFKLADINIQLKHYGKAKKWLNQTTTDEERKKMLLQKIKRQK